MKFFIILWVSLFTMAAQASDFEIRSVYKNSDRNSSKKYLVVARDSEFFGEEFVVIFGNKEGKLKTRIFDAGYRFYVSPRVGSRIQDNFYTIDVKGIEDDVSFKAKFTGVDSRYNTEKIYNKTESAGSLRFARNAINKALLKFEKLSKVKNPSSLGQFKDLLNLKIQQSSNDSLSEHEYPFRILWLQIETDFKWTKPNRALAKAKIKKNGSDAISKKYLMGDDKIWYKSASDAAYEVEEIVMRRGFDDYDDAPTRSYYSQESSSIEDSVLLKGAKKFVKYEVGTISGFDCEDGFAEEATITWILTDGSTLTYYPGIECD